MENWLEEELRLCQKLLTKRRQEENQLIQQHKDDLRNRHAAIMDWIYRHKNFVPKEYMDELIDIVMAGSESVLDQEKPHE